MGTRFEIVVATDDECGTRPVLEEAIHEIEQLHTQLTRFARESLLSHINRTAWQAPVRLDRSTFDLFRQAAHVSELSGGAFDVTLGTGAFWLDETHCSIALQSRETRLDLGGIAKGYALDRAGAVLREAGVAAALLHGGTSSVLAIGAPPHAPSWRIAIAHTRNVHADLCDNALSVSRPYAQIVDGRTHIVDPRSPRTRLRDSISIVKCASAMMADAWSTAISVLGHIPRTNELMHAELAD